MTVEFQVQIAASPGAAKPAKECTVTVEPIAAEAGAPSGVTAPGARYRLRIGDRQYVVDARRAEERGNLVSWTLIDDQGRQQVVDIDGAATDFKISVAGGDSLSARALDSRDLVLRGGGASGATGSGELRAAMPGKVVKVLCKVGDVVKAGQGLLVIEAMKMENELRATLAGKVTAVAVREGQTVDGGQSLVSIGSE
jgi:biotin carboxyl carrier protein